MTDVQTAVVRIARAGIKLASEGDIASAQLLIKTADALSQGYDLPTALNAYVAKEAHEKVAKAIIEIAEQPSEVALQKQAMLKEAKEQILKEALQRKQASSKKK